MEIDQRPVMTTGSITMNRAAPMNASSVAMSANLMNPAGFVPTQPGMGMPPQYSYGMQGQMMPP